MLQHTMPRVTCGAGKAQGKHASCWCYVAFSRVWLSRATICGGQAFHCCFCVAFRNILLAALFALLGVLTVLAYSQPLLAVAFLPLALIYRWLQVGSWSGLAVFFLPIFTVRTYAPICIGKSRSACVAYAMHGVDSDMSYELLESIMGTSNNCMPL